MDYCPEVFQMQELRRVGRYMAFIVSGSIYIQFGATLPLYLSRIIYWGILISVIFLDVDINMKGGSSTSSERI